VKVDASELRRLQQRLGTAEQAVRAALPGVVRHAAERLVERVDEDFAAKASGGAGADGSRWPPVRQAQRLIGVQTGALRESADVMELQGSQARIGYMADYAFAFDTIRPLIPDPLPRAWMRELDRYNETTLGRVLAEHLK
jgi:hypothetical protein